MVYLRVEVLTDNAVGVLEPQADGLRPFFY